ncbi:MAG: 23S rRNA (uracil(1939)-C(5))-methyltransferase RlmD [Eubacteriales bacterium]|nr:23S rRNA (uracil(1939)-C(5))-methyltransferase RlmD [Eubacteriales bacterium]
MRQAQATTKIESLNAQAQGVAHLNGKCIFVPGALPGERIEGELIKSSKSYDVYRVLERQSTSPDRRIPFCAHYRRCGGCQMQHMSYEATLIHKRQQVVDVMKRIGGISEADALCTNCLGLDLQAGDMLPGLHYRNKVVYAIERQRGRVELGFYQARSHRLVPIDACSIHFPCFDRLAAQFRDFLEQQRASIYDESKKRGCFRKLMIRRSRATGELLVCVVGQETLPSKLRRALIDCLLACELGQGERLASIYYNRQPAHDNRIFGEKFEKLYGLDAIEDELLGLHFRLSPASFFQVNAYQTEILYRQALDLLDIHAGETAFDLYCGTGTLSLMMASTGAEVHGVEIVPEAVRDARENAKRNRLSQVHFHEGASEEVLGRLLASGVVADCLMIDPPRKGAEPSLIRDILQLAPRKMVYISCHPATQARDLKLLLAAGSYQLEKIVPVDMFPWTAHVETVCLMSRKV